MIVNPTEGPGALFLGPYRSLHPYPPPKQRAEDRARAAAELREREREWIKEEMAQPPKPAGPSRQVRRAEARRSAKRSNR